MYRESCVLPELQDLLYTLKTHAIFHVEHGPIMSLPAMPGESEDAPDGLLQNIMEKVSDGVTWTTYNYHDQDLMRLIEHVL